MCHQSIRTSFFILWYDLWHNILWNDACIFAKRFWQIYQYQYQYLLSYQYLLLHQIIRASVSVYSLVPETNVRSLNKCQELPYSSFMYKWISGTLAAYFLYNTKVSCVWIELSLWQVYCDICLNKHRCEEQQHCPLQQHYKQRGLIRSTTNLQLVCKRCRQDELRVGLADRCTMPPMPPLPKSCRNIGVPTSYTHTMSVTD